jgi:hypothetical protein
MTLNISVDSFVWSKVNDLNSGIIWPTVADYVPDDLYDHIDESVYWPVLNTGSNAVINFVKDTIRYHDT